MKLLEKCHLLFYLLGAAIGYPQERDSLAVLKTATPYIKHYDEYISTRIGFNNNFNRFKFNVSDLHLKYFMTPNQRIRTTFSFLFRFIEFDIGFTPSFLKFNRDDELHGKTTFSSLGTQLYFGQWMQTLQWNTTKGYYVDARDLGLAEDSNIIFPDVKIRKVGGSSSYIFNPNYSFRAINKQKEWQGKSAGSFVPTFSYYFTHVSDATPGTNKIYNLAIGPGYYYNWVIAGHFLVSAGGFMGIGYNNTGFEFTDDREDYKVDGITYETEFKMTLAHNTSHFFTGASISISSFYHKIDPTVRYTDQQEFFEFYLGYRFKAPEKIMKKITNVEKKLGL